MLHLAGALRTARKMLSEEAILAEWQSVTAVKAAAEQPLAATLQGIFMQQADQVLSRLEEVLRSIGVTKRSQEIDPLLVQGLFDIMTWDEVIARSAAPHLRAVIEEGFRTGALRVSLEIPSTFQSSPRTESILEEVLSKTKDVNQTTLKDLAAQIGQGLTAGESIPEIGRRVEQYFEGITTWRAQLIAQTAATPAFEVSQQEAFLEAEIEHNWWLSQRDASTRSDHYEADGQTRKIGEAFDVGGYQLLHPGDPSAPADQVIGCRCTLMPGENPSSEKALAHKRTAGRSNLDLSSAAELMRSVLNDREIQRVDLALRDYAIRAAYPDMQLRYGQVEAIARLAGEHHVSESTVKRAIWG